MELSQTVSNLGSVLGCPILGRGMYQTIYGMDLVDWGTGANTSLEAVYTDPDTGNVIAVIGGQSVNLAEVPHIQAAVMIVPKAIQTRNDGISWVDLLPTDILNVGIGTPLFYGTPGWGTTFKIAVGCP